MGCFILREAQILSMILRQRIRRLGTYRTFFATSVLEGNTCTMLHACVLDSFYLFQRARGLPCASTFSFQITKTPLYIDTVFTAPLVIVPSHRSQAWRLQSSSSFSQSGCSLSSSESGSDGGLWGPPIGSSTII